MTDNVWTLEIEISGEHTDIFIENLEEIADSISCFELDDEGVRWKLIAYCEFEEDIKNVEQDVKNTCKRLNIEENYEVIAVENIDWVSESQKDFDPVDAGRFFVHASWRKDELPHDKITIEIDPQQSFGTGQHETTKGCLIKIDELGNKKSEINNVLDMGCGSGILAIAAAKIWVNSAITAVDNDPICIETTLENTKINATKYIKNIAVSDGYVSDIVRNNGPYDLIISNILAAPLIDFAPDLGKVIAKGGSVILAGLLCEQADAVIAVHEKEGLRLVDQLNIGKWSILQLSA